MDGPIFLNCELDLCSYSIACGAIRGLMPSAKDSTCRLTYKTLTRQDGKPVKD